MNDLAKSYTSNYLKVYSWKILGIMSGFISLLIVIPKLTSDPDVYGIYAISVSLGVFLSYADIGFLNAGQKYAAECYARRDLISETKILGFVHFILFIFIALFAIIILVLSTNPSILFTSFSPENSVIASRILSILGVSSFVIVLQRFAQSVFNIRIEDYLYQRIEVISNLIKISSVFYFFRSGHYDIVEYYLFFQFMTLISAVITIIIIKKKYKYDLSLVLRNFKFSRDIYNTVSKLAFSSLFVTFMWVLYYEMDTIVISKMYGARAVSIYAIGLSVLSFSRSLYGTLFAPFLARINHFAGQKQFEKINSFLSDIIRISFPLSVFPAVVMIIMMPALVVAWVGNDYKDSIPIAQFLISLVLFYCFTNPLSYLLIAKEKFRALYVTSTLLAAIFIIVFLSIRNQVGLVSLAVAKATSIFFYMIALVCMAVKSVNFSLPRFFFNLLLKAIAPVFLLLIILYITRGFWSYGNVKGISALIKIGAVGGGSSLICIFFFYMIDRRSKDIAYSILHTVFDKHRNYLRRHAKD
jgi:O-antigen/teichoic acid export membrane protein